MFSTYLQKQKYTMKIVKTTNTFKHAWFQIGRSFPSRGFDHHGHSLQRIGASVELCPVDSVLVTTAIVPASVPHPVQIGVGTHVVPPAPFLEVSTVTWGGNTRFFFTLPLFIFFFTIWGGSGSGGIESLLVGGSSPAAPPGEQICRSVLEQDTSL